MSVPQAVVKEIEQWEREGRSGYIKLKVSRGQIVHLFRDYGDPVTGVDNPTQDLTAPVPAQ